MNFCLSGMDESGEEVFLNIDASDQGFVFKFSNTYDVLDFDLKEGCEKIRTYNNNYGGGTPYYLRPYYKKFADVVNLSTAQENMLRAFAVTSGFIQFWYSNDYNGLKSKLSFYEEFDQYLSDQLLLDWTGDMDVQPQMYFLPLELTEKYIIGNSRSPELEELYNLRLVQFFRTKGEIVFQNYYVPLIIPETEKISKCFKSVNTLRLWQNIVKGINSEIRRLVSHNRNRNT